MTALEALARRVEDDSTFLACLLAHFARSERLDDAALAERLGCPPDQLAALRLCRSPRPEPNHFRADVARIAGHFGLDVNRLLEAIRRGQVLLALQSPLPRPAGLLAARDRPGEDRP